MGRLPKPPSERVNRGKRKTAADLVVLNNNREVPDPPDWLSPDLYEHWHNVWMSDVAQTYQDQDFPLVLDYFNLLSQLAESETDIRLQGTYYTVSNGTRVAHPLLKIVDAFRKQIDKKEEKLLLSPYARRKSGFSFGEAVESGGGLDLLKVDFGE